MAEPYKSKYSGAQIDAAVRSMGLIPAIYVSYAEYKANLDILNSAVNGMVTSFNKFFEGITFDGTETFKKMFDDRSSALQSQYDTFTANINTKVDEMNATAKQLATDWGTFDKVSWEKVQ